MQLEMQADIREQESAQARLQFDAMEAERAAQVESERALYATLRATIFPILFRTIVSYCC